mgnify:CR=1 FL=1
MMTRESSMTTFKANLYKTVVVPAWNNRYASIKSWRQNEFGGFYFTVSTNYNLVGGVIVTLEDELVDEFAEEELHNFCL